MLLAAAIIVFSLSSEEMARVETATELLKELSHEMDAECRQYPSQAQTLAGCAARNVYLDILEFRNVCNFGPFVQDEEWVPCVPQSDIRQ
jgi:hypothetical protein